MFSDLKTNRVLFSIMFQQRWPELFAFIKTALQTCGVSVELISGNYNIWARDWMPLQVGNKYIKFSYKGYGAGYDNYPWLNIPLDVIHSVIPKNKLIQSNLVLDGGGVIRCEGKAILTEKVFLDNPTLSKSEILACLYGALGCDEIIIIPIEPGDDLGHADGIVKFVDEKTVLLNNYLSMDDKIWVDYRDKVSGILQKSGLNVKFMPYAYHKCPQLQDNIFKTHYPLADDNNPAIGYYINFLLTKTCILLPVFGFDEDQDALAVVRECYPRHVVIPIYCSQLSMEGGLMNCVTMNYISD